MSMENRIGVGNVARTVEDYCVGANGVARRVVELYVGINGVAQLYWVAYPEWNANTNYTVGDRVYR